MRQNYDLVSWSVGRCTSDLVTIAYNLDIPLNTRGQTWVEFIETIVSKTGAKCLLYNHTLETLKTLDLITDDYEVVRAIPLRHQQPHVQVDLQVRL